MVNNDSFLKSRSSLSFLAFVEVLKCPHNRYAFHQTISFLLAMFNPQHLSSLLHGMFMRPMDSTNDNFALTINFYTAVWWVWMDRVDGCFRANWRGVLISNLRLYDDWNVLKSINWILRVCSILSAECWRKAREAFFYVWLRVGCVDEWNEKQRVQACGTQMSIQTLKMYYRQMQRINEILLLKTNSGDFNHVPSFFQESAGPCPKPGRKDHFFSLSWAWVKSRPSQGFSLPANR